MLIVDDELIPAIAPHGARVPRAQFADFGLTFACHDGQNCSHGSADS